jgi:hypothetical protein
MGLRHQSKDWANEHPLAGPIIANQVVLYNLF